MVHRAWADGRAELVRLATRLIVEEALEAENRDALGPWLKRFVRCTTNKQPIGFR